MDFYELDLDEAIIIQSSNVTRDGYDESEFEDEYLREIILTNKQIMYVVAPDEEADGEDCDIITVPLNAVKVINGQAQVKQVQHDLYNLCLQIQFVHGVEYWRFGVKAKQQIPVWVTKISDAVSSLTEGCECAYEKTHTNTVYQSKATSGADTCFCVNCGATISRSAKFCSECGEKVGQNSPPINVQADVVYDGRIHKCKNCGETLNAFETVCPLCGYELRDTYASATIRAFAEKMEGLQKNGKHSDKGKIINLIRTFPIPNTKEDLFEFIILASSNIREDRYSSDLPKYKKEISDAWRAKFEQAYHKACISFAKDSSLARIKEIYKAKNTEIRGNKLNGFFKNTGAIIGSVLLVLLCVAIPWGILFGIQSSEAKKIEKENQRLEAIVEEVYEALEAENYTLARAKTASLTFSGPDSSEAKIAEEKWDKTRKELLEIIDKAEYGQNYLPPATEGDGD